MAVVFMEGFDKYGPTASGPGSPVPNLAMITGEWTSGSFSLAAPLSATGMAASIVLSLIKNFPTNYPRLIGGLRFNVPGTTSGSVTLMQFMDASTAQCVIDLVSSTGVLELRNGTNAGTLLNSVGGYVANTIRYLEWDITFGNSAAYQIWLDGVSVFSGTGDTTGTVNNYANQIEINSAGFATFIDDLYLFDTTGTTNNAVLLTSPRIETTFPSSDSAVQFGFGAGVLGDVFTHASFSSAPGLNSLVLRRLVPGANCTLSSVVTSGLTSAGANVRPVVYADSGGVAGTLLGSGATVTGIVSGVLITLPLTTPLSLVGGTPYWLGFMVDNTANFVTCEATGPTTVRGTATFTSGAPSTAPTMTASGTYLIYGTLTAVGANFPEVSQQPPTSLSYVTDTVVNHEDLYGFPALSVTPPQIYTVAVKGFAQKIGVGLRTVSLRAKSGAVDSGGSNVSQTPVIANLSWLSSNFDTDPNTGAAWTKTGLDAATSGFRIDS